MRAVTVRSCHVGSSAGARRGRAAGAVLRAVRRINRAGGKPQLSQLKCAGRAPRLLA